MADLSHATIDISNLLPQGPHPWEKGNSAVFARSIVVDINVLSFFPLRCCAHTSINLSIHPFIHPASQPSIHPSVHPSIRPSVHQVKKSPSKSKSKQTKRLDVCAQQRRGKNDKTLISTTMDLAKTTELPFSHGSGPCVRHLGR